MNSAPTFEDLAKPPYSGFVHRIAHEADIKEVDECFRTLPWCCYIILSLPERKIISREDYEKALIENLSQTSTESSKESTTKEVPNQVGVNAS